MNKTYEAFTPAVGKPLPYLQFLPVDAESSDKTYPLVIFLAGMGELGEDLDRVTVHSMPHHAANGTEYPFILVCPQIPEWNLWYAYIETLNRFLDHLLATLPVDKDRVILTGLSNGGIGTWLWGCNDPDRFAALIPVCGEGIEPFAPYLNKTPVWVFHGELDPVVSCDSSRRMVEIINRNGGNAKLTVYPGVGHDSWVPAYAEPELVEWIMEKKRGQE